MRRALSALVLGLLCAAPVGAQGLLVPTQADVPPLALRGHEVTVSLEDQVAVTRVVQTFRNDTDRQLEATYVFPVPKGASVRKFTMWVDGKEVPGELVEADKARQVYTDIVRRTQDPGLLEYLGNNLLRVRVFPVPARGEQKLAVSYTSVALGDSGLVEYVYPLRADASGPRTLERFSFDATIKAQHPIQNVYSPSHPIKVTRKSDREARVRFDSTGAVLDKDLQLYYTSGGGDVGLTALLHRPRRDEDGHFMLLISPRAELSKSRQVPRDMVFVLDTSGSMQGKRIVQARNALEYCLRNLNPRDRFAVIQFATAVNKYRDQLLPASGRHVEDARHWVNGLEAVGSTNINDALLAALEMRPRESGRTFTVVFFTDGQPTISECDPQRIVKNVAVRNTASTRIFTFGVGDNVNAVLLDQLAEQTRSVSTYVRESEDIEARVSGLYSKISHPVLTGLRLKVGKGVTLSEVYPPQLPDLFHGSQLVVVGRYRGHGPAEVTLTGSVGEGETGEPTERSNRVIRASATVRDSSRQFGYEVDFPRKTGREKAFVEDLWARRKVGYLLDQIRVNGEKKELVEEVVRLAKRHGITTPYTSYLVAPDAPRVASAPQGSPNPGFDFGSHHKNHGYPINAPAAGQPIQGVNSAVGATAGVWTTPGNGGLSGSGTAAPMPASAPPRIQYAPVLVAPTTQWAAPQGYAITPAQGPAAAPVSVEEEFGIEMGGGPVLFARSGQAGVDLAVKLAEMRNQNQVGQSAKREVAGRTCIQVSGGWADLGYDSKQKQAFVKAMSKAYFRILERQPQMAEVFRLGNRLLWVTPCGEALVIDPVQGVETMTDSEIDRLFVAKK